MRIPAAIFDLQGGSPQTRKDAARMLKSVGAIPAGPGIEPELVVWCDTVHDALPDGWWALNDLADELTVDHRPRDTKAVAALPTREPRNRLLEGRAVALIGGFSRVDCIMQLVEKLGGTLVAPPSIDADIVLCGSLDGLTDRMKAIRADAVGRMLLSEWQFYDLCEPQFSAFPADQLQRELAAELRSTDRHSARLLAGRPCALTF